MRLVQPRDASRDTDREVAGQGGLHDGACRVDVHVARCGGGRHLAEVERVDGPGVLPDHHESAASDVSGDGMDHRERERHGHGCVDGVAAAMQDVHTHFARERMRRHDHGALANHLADPLAERPPCGDARARAGHHVSRLA